MAGIICAANALKEVMTAGDSLAALKEGVSRAGTLLHGEFVISDGGDGFLEACGRGKRFKRYDIPCTGPLGDSITAPILVDIENKRAFIEIAECCGLRLVEPERRNILISGTAGVADLVAAARELGAREVLIGLGGSATCDGGIGFIWRLADVAGQCRQQTPEPRVAMDMPELPSPDIPALRKWVGPVKIIGCVDVNNPLRGPNGAARVFAPQKGATDEQTEQLEGWMGDWCTRIERNAGIKLCDLCGAGAAGGLGFALAAVGGELAPGAQTISELIGLTKAITPGTIILTTEGKFDSTSFSGKAPWEVSIQARKNGADPIIFCGIADEKAVRDAENKGVRIIQFGRDLPADKRIAESPGKLAASVAEYLKSLAGKSK